ncbi:methionine--tRNA ligase, cytoplasmic [Sitodiplosis mosellana]|uniref:methionine--tRNA ligase, cytoplasmic n=1 Tax=Sitodiplosis mosellana TaxID=263140 RepID=UPI00244390FD|nr:methionine--tRNA ligase, cytoplasmic [Sitodiplosis mosellana]
MIIYNNKGNPYGLKVEICVRLAGSNIVIKEITSADLNKYSFPHFPLLELNNGNYIFSTDAIIKYLLPNEEPIELRDQWLEWSSTRLAPAIISKNMIGHPKQAQAEAVLNHLILQLDLQLTDRNTLFLTGSKPTSADFSIWSFLAQDKTTLKLPRVHEWFNRVASEPCIMALNLNLKQMKIDVSAVSKANKFGGIPHIRVEVPIIENECRGLDDSPSHISETITEAELAFAKNSFIFIESATVAEPKTVLPKPNQRNILVTSALPYVNNVPHLGNIIGCVLSADIFARYSRLAGYTTLYIGGTDEYGTATETKALAENLTPQQICDKYFDIHNNIYRWFGIGFDYFGRTSAAEHKTIVQQFFKELHGTGYLKQESVDQLLCQKCDRYLADRFVEGTCPHPGCSYEDARGDQCDGCGKLINAVELIRPRCKICNAAPIIRASKQFFLDLPKIEDTLTEYVDSVSSSWTYNARVITKAWLKEGLKPRCITRDLKWGVPVPLEGYENKVFYVWFDAVLGYISITSRYTKEWKQWWQPKNENIKIDLFQFMAKDNVPFHSVVMPSMLLAMKNRFTKVTHIMATEYLNYEDGKFSKSRGIGVFGNDAQDTGIPADVWRYYLAAARPEAQDSSFSWNDLIARNNSELLNNLGNFINRALVFCEKNFNSTISAIQLSDVECNLLALINREIKGYIFCMEKGKLRDGIRHTMSISRNGNQYLQSQQPWVLLKGSEEEKKRAATIISFSCNIACILASLLSPFMPETSRRICSQLNIQRIPVDVDKPALQQHLKAGHKIGKPVPLFEKIEQSRLEELKRRYGGSQEESQHTSEKNANIQTIEDMKKLVAVQGSKLRELKASKAEKNVVQEEVKILLDLKEKLENLRKKSNIQIQ